MALTWDITACGEEVRSDDYDWTVTDSLIWATIGVGIQEITEANHLEFWTRMQIQARVFGYENRTTVAQVRQHIGLKTNATPYTKVKFNGLMSKALWDQAKEDMRKRSEASLVK